MAHEEIPDIILGSRTQSAETVRRIAEGEDYNVTLEVQSDEPEELPVEPEQPAEEAAPPAEQPPVAEVAAPAEETEESEGEEPEVIPPASAETPQPPRKPGKFAKIKAANRLLQQERDNLARQLEEARKGIAPKPADAPAAPVKAEPPAPATPPAAETADPEPNADDFENGIYDPKYIKALNQWSYREARRDERRQEAQHKQEEEQSQKRQNEEQAKAAMDAEAREAQDRWDSSVKSVKDAHPDYDQVMNQAPDKIPVTPAMVTVVRDQENPAEIAYWLGKHPEEAQKLAKMTMLPENPSGRLVRQAIAQARQEIDRIQVLIANEEPDPEDGEPEPAAEESRETPPEAPRAGVQPPARPPQPPAKAAPAAKAPPPAAPIPPKVPTPKAEPPTHVGGRGTAGPSRNIEDLARASRGSAAEKQIRDMSDDEYRASRGMS